MKKLNQFLAAALCGGTLALSAYGEKVRVEDLPLELRDKIKAQTGGAPIDDIDRATRGGRTFYEVGFKKNGQHTELLFDEQGQLQNAPAGAVDSRKVTFAELPPVVQQVVQTRLRGAVPNDIDRQVRNGEIRYEVGFRENEQQQEIVVSQEGRIVQDVRIADASIAAAAAGTANPAALPLSNKQKMTYEELPDRVKQTVTTSSKGSRIEDVERGQWRARTIYEIAFKDGAQHVELQVDENGRVLHDPRLTATGVPAASVQGAAASPAYPNVTTAVALSASEKIDRRSIPAAVEQSLRRHAPGAVIEDVERGSWRGINVYEVGFKDQGRHVELQIDERGQIVFDPRQQR